MKLTKTLVYLFSGLILAAGTISCNEDLLNNDPLLQGADQNLVEEQVAEPDVCGYSTYTLWAGQTINAGTLVVSNDAENLYVTYNTTGVFKTLHLWVGTDLSLLPLSGGGAPINGQFPYTFDASGLTTHTFTIPLASISFYNNNCGSKIFVVAHAEVEINGENETAYGGDKPVNVMDKGRWYYYSEFTTFCCDVNPPTPKEKLGTAFAKGGYVFTTDKKANPEKLPSLNLTRNRWGWAINITSTGSFEYQLWVGAGLNYVSKGLLVGKVSVDYNGSQVTVSYDLDYPYSIEEAHVYAGDFRPSTIAPGQYGNTYYFNPFETNVSYTYDVTDTNGDGVWVIAHAVAYGTGVTNP